MFITDQIVLKPVSIEDAVKAAKDRKAPRSLDQIIADIDSANKQVKTASSAAETKTASAPEAKPEPKEAKTASTEEKKPEPEAEVKVEVKVAKPEAKAEPKKAAAEKSEKKAESKPEKKAEAKTKSLKLAKALDFRGWDAAKVAKAWGQYGSMEKCEAGVKGKTSDPKTYCALLRTAGGMAAKQIKEASAKAKPAKKASASFKKLAKLTEKERAWLAGYWGKLYGEGYVKAMLGDY